jgi:hypothetical protein
MPPAGSSMPPPGSSMPPGLESGAYAASASPISRSLRMLKTQLNFAVGQREEDPERAWLEAVSVRERLETVAEGVKGDPLLVADVERFRSRLMEQLKKLTRDIGDEVVAPLYSWVDLVRQRARLESEVETARLHVAEARASRGAPPAGGPSTAEEAVGAVESAEKELQWWKSETPPLPQPEALVVWTESGGDALRPGLPLDPQRVRSRGVAARALIEPLRGTPLGLAPYAGSKVELAVLPSVGAVAVLSVMFAFARAGPHLALSALAALACGTFGVAAVASIHARRRATTERRAAIDVVWHHTFFTEQATSIDLEVGWMRALSAALRARKAFDAHKAEGGQLAELAKWRPDLEPVVGEVAKSSLAPGAL